MKKLLLLILCSFTLPAFCQWTGPDAAAKIYYNKGFVGVGVLPAYRLHLKSVDSTPLLFAETPSAELSFTGSLVQLKSKASGVEPSVSWVRPDGATLGSFKINDDFLLGLQNGADFLISGGRVGIGVNDTKGYELAVGGKIISEEVVVKLRNLWPDYVFDPTYSLTPLAEIEKYVKVHKHLPDLPPASSVASNGLCVGDVTTALTKKVEELTLHLIAERKRTEDLYRRIEELENKVSNVR
jgi:hypothetical protein